MGKLFQVSVKNTVDLRALAQEHPRAISRALNRTAASVKTEASAAIRETYNIKKSDVDRAIKIPKEATPTRLMTYVLAGSSRFNLGVFGLRQLKKNRAVSIEIKRGQRKKVAGWFAVRSRDGNLLAYRRVGPERRQIKSVIGMSISDMFASRIVQERMIAKVDERFPIELDHQLEAILKGYAGENLGRGWKSGGKIPT